MLELLQRICTLLDHAKIQYMLSGSLALNIYTVPRMTRDIDIVISLDEEQLPQFLEHFPEQDFYVSPQAVYTATRSHQMFNIIDYTSGFKLDFIVLQPTPFRQAEFQRRIRTEVLGFPVYVVQVEDLILSKLLWIQELDSERQHSDLQQLLALEDLDWNYLNHWADQLKIKTFGYFANE